MGIVEEEGAEKGQGPREWMLILKFQEQRRLNQNVISKFSTLLKTLMLGFL